MSIAWGSSQVSSTIGSDFSLIDVSVIAKKIEAGKELFLNYGGDIFKTSTEFTSH